MKNKHITLKRFFCSLLLMCMLSTSIASFTATASSESDVLDFYTFGGSKDSNTRINTQIINGESFFILPSSANPESITLYLDSIPGDINIKGELKEDLFIPGEPINLNDYCKEENYSLTFSCGESIRTVKFAFSANIPSVYLISEDPDTKGRLWVESSITKENKAKGHVVVQKENGEIYYEGKLSQIKGRGNSTWVQEKKPYQIKTEEKVDLLDTDNSNNASKTWVLLANYFDSTLLNNHYALNLGKELGMSANIETSHVDLYYDGEYRGTYLLSEKVEVHPDRVDIENMEEKNQDANPGADLESYPIASATTKNGVFYTYCDGAVSPDDISGGYLLEMDFIVRAKEEASYFRTTRGQHVVVKSPEYATKEEMEYISTLYQEYEDAVFNGGINPDTGKAYSDYVDKESIAVYYLIGEFSKAKDIFESSAYLYKKSGEDKMYMGPLWDYDLSFGKSRYDTKEPEPARGENIYNTKLGRKLVQIKDFSKLLCDMYTDKLYPVITDVMLGSYNAVSESGYIHSIEHEKTKLEASAQCNDMLWNENISWSTDTENLCTFITERAEFLKNTFGIFADTARDSSDVFGDVAKEYWFYDDVTNVTSSGYMSAEYNTFFDPYAFAKRGSVAQTLFKVSGDSAPLYESIYNDVTENDSYPEIVWAYKEGFMDGFPDGSFRPASYVTREQMVTILYRYKKEPPVEGSISDLFIDKAKVSPYAEKAIIWALETGLLQGDNNGRLSPQGNMTRAELATIISRFLELEK